MRPCLGQGASQGEEAVLADSGREGEIVAGVGWVRTATPLNILREGCLVPVQVSHWHIEEIPWFHMNVQWNVDSF